MPLTESPHEGRHVDVGDTRLFVVERGQEGYPLIALHAVGRDHWSFADYLDGLAPDLHVVLPDLRGHGMSDPAAVESLAQLAADVVRLADALELERFALLGHGDGARVAVRAALDAPDRVSHLVVVAPQVDVAAEQPEGEYRRRSAPAIDRPEHAGALRDALPEDARIAAPALVVDETAYPFVDAQDAFLDGLKRFVLA
jgi:pimeloyl-ACP methyl ester carboxylesterase